MTISELMNRAQQCHRTGDLEQAEQIYQQVVAIDPNNANAIHLFGVLALQLSRFETATRYIQEFERLLAKVSQNDRDGSQWRAYLLSNTGKVYTILAHASGRLG